MTREEAIKNLKFVRGVLNDDSRIAQSYDMAISALSTDGEYIKKEDALKALHDFWDECINFDGSGTELMLDNEGVIDDLPTYSFPDSAENKGKSKHGHWVRMSDLPEDKDDRYKCSRCGNVVHHSNGVNLYTFNSWCGKCGSLNNSLIAGLEPKGEKGTE